jgi:cobalt/nickel transport system permease protein
MHISEGILSPPVLAAGWGFAAAGIAIGLKKTSPEVISKVAVLSAASFLISLVRVPVGPASVHLTLFGIMGVMLGIRVIPAIFIALLLQALLFQFGGLTVLGANTVNLSAAALAAYIIYRYSPAKIPLAVKGFSAGFAAVIVGSTMVVSAIYISDGNFLTTAKLIFAANIPLALVEGIITMFILIFLQKMLPEYVQR